MQDNQLIKRAYAKINLYLHITGRRNDGFHLLDSLVTFVDVYDVVEVSPSDDISLRVTGPFAKEIGKTEDNLVIKAALLLQKRMVDKKGAKINLIKNIPPASGMGGGSSDAAAVLHLLCKIWGLDFSTAEIQNISLSLGADLPVCVTGKSCHVSGIGEIITPVSNLAEGFTVLVNPGKKAESKIIYQMGIKKISEQIINEVLAEDTIENFADVLSHAHNDLSVNAVKIVPEIITILKILHEEKACLLARMSGSGATCFGLFKDKESAETVAEKIRLRFKDWWVKPAALIHDTEKI